MVQQQDAPVRVTAPEVDERTTGSLSGLAVVVLAFVVLGFLFVAFDGNRSTVDLPVAPSVVTAPTIPATTVAAGLDASGFVRAEKVVLDHEPTVVGAPGPGVPLLGAETDIAVLYVNSIGRPTLIDLDTGQRREVEISPLRAQDSFLVEHGDVVSHDRAYLAPAAATDRAIRILVERPDRATPSGGVSRDLDGPVLCLQSVRCPEIRWTQTSFGDGTDTVATLDAGLYPDVAAFFDLDDWIEDGRWLIAPDRVGVNFRLPAPLPSSTFWLIHQPDQP